MPELLFTPEKSLLYLSGCGSILYQPGSPAALSGKLLPEKLAVPSGTWFSYPARFFQPDRFRLKAARLDGELWLGLPGKPAITLFAQQGEFCLLTEKMLCCSAEARSDAFLVRLLPGSVKKALCITRCRLDGKTAACMATAGVPEEIRVRENEELKVAIHSVVAWQGCQIPKSFCPKLRWRDLILPRLPQNLVLTFRGPGRVWVEASGLPERRARKHY